MSLDDHVRRVRSAAQLLNEVVDAATRDGFTVWLCLDEPRVHGQSRRLVRYQVYRAGRSGIRSAILPVEPRE